MSAVEGMGPAELGEAVRAAAAKVDRGRVLRFAAQMMAMIAEHVEAGAIPVSLGSFGEVDKYTDRNMFYEWAGQQFDGLDPVCLAECNAIHDELDRRIRDGALIPELVAEGNDMSEHVISVYGSWERYRAVVRAVWALGAAA